MKLDWHFNFWLMFVFAALSLLSGAIFTPETVRHITLLDSISFEDTFSVCSCAASAPRPQAYAPIQRDHPLRLQPRSRPPKVRVLELWPPLRSVVPCIHFRCAQLIFYAVLVTEPIVLCVAFYISISYATLYCLFAAFPIVFQQHHHFTAAQGGLAFSGLGLGIIVGLASTPIQNRIYWKAIEKSETGRAAPEA